MAREDIPVLQIPYDDFKMGDLIDPEQFDLNNLYFQNKVNEIVRFVNLLIASGGGEIINITPVPPFTATTVQGFLNEFTSAIQSITPDKSGATVIGSAPLTNLPGVNVEQQLKSINNLLDTAFVTTLRIANSAITTAKLADKAVTTPKVEDLAVTTQKIGQGAVTSDKIQNEAVTNEKIKNDAVTTPKILNQAVTTEKYADQSVTIAKIKDANVTTPKIADSNVTTPKIANLAVAREKLADSSVDGVKLAWQSVGKEHILAKAITSDKLMERAVTGDKIGLQTIKQENIDPVLLEALPNTLLTAKVLKLEDEMDAVQYTNALQQESIDEIPTLIEEGKKVTDTVTGAKFKWVVEDGKLYVEEVN